MLRDSDEGKDDGLCAECSDATGKPARRRRTAAAQEPDMTHPMRCASQLMPFESQKLLWSMACVLSDGQDDELAMNYKCVQRWPLRRSSWDYIRGIEFRVSCTIFEAKRAVIWVVKEGERRVCVRRDEGRV